MIGFLIKKNFFDMWDNLFRIALINIGFIVSLSLPIFLPSLFTNIPALGIAVLVAGVLWCFVYLSTAALCLKTVSDYGSFGFVDFYKNFKEVWPIGLVMGALACLITLLILIVIPFYVSLGSIVGLILAAIVFWILVVAALSLQFFFAVRSRLDTKISKIFKKCLIVFFDNPMFCVFMMIGNIAMLVISTFSAFLFPGPAGILLFMDQGLRLRLLKYDWLEENPEANKKDIPWDALLIDDRERTGTRTLRSFIFPWKD